MKTYKGTITKLFELLANPPAEIATSTHFTINENNITYLYPITPQALLEVNATHPNITIILWRSQGEQNECSMLCGNSQPLSRYDYGREIPSYPL